MFRESRTAFSAALVFAIGATATSSIAVAKPSIACGSLYTVVRGDTLFKISDRSYANGRLYKKIFEANRDLLPNMQSVEIGDQLLIPCLDGTGPATHSAAMALASSIDFDEMAAQITVFAFAETVDPIEFVEVSPQNAGVGFVEIVDPIEMPVLFEVAELIEMDEAIEAAELIDDIEPVELAELADTIDPVVSSERMRIITGSGFAPFADKFLPAGGMITDLITRGVKSVAPDQDIRVSFINDWNSHLETLIPENAYDVSFPWIKPNCADVDGLNDMTQSLCDNYEFSNPFFEVAVGYYTLSDNPLIAANDLAYLQTKRICRPKGQFQFGPTQASLLAPTDNVEYQQTAVECLNRLASGEVDVVNLLKSDADVELLQFSDADQIAEIEGLATTLTLHAVVAKSSSKGQANLAMINQGLASLMASGEWFEVVVRHRSERLAQLK